eukprot:scaffold8411_cov21-Tisochrysis_lutea.AAC.1
MSQCKSAAPAHVLHCCLLSHAAVPAVALQKRQQQPSKRRGFAALPLHKAKTDSLEEVQIRTKVSTCEKELTGRGTDKVQNKCMDLRRDWLEDMQIRNKVRRL